MVLDTPDTVLIRQAGPTSLKITTFNPDAECIATSCLECVYQPLTLEGDTASGSQISGCLGIEDNESITLTYDVAAGMELPDGGAFSDDAGDGGAGDASTAVTVPKALNMALVWGGGSASCATLNYVLNRQ